MLRSCARLSALLFAVTLASAQGVDQRPGPDGVLGKSYRINREYPLEFTLNKLEYTLGRVRFGPQCQPCQANEKLLVVHFQVQNATQDTLLFRFDSIYMTAVDSNKDSHEYYKDYAGDPGGAIVSMDLKPAQKIACYTTVALPTDAKVSKLIVLPREDDAPVIRYDLTGKIGGLPAGQADPADKSGETPLAELPGKPGEYQVMGNFDCRVDAAGITTDKVPDNDLEEGKVWYAITLTLKNQAPAELQVGGLALDATVLLDDESELKKYQLMLAKAPKFAEFAVRPGAERALRLFFEMGKDDKPATLRIKGMRIVNGTDGESRPVVIPLKDAPKP